LATVVPGSSTAQCLRFRSIVIINGERKSVDLPLRSGSASRGWMDELSFQIRNVDRDGDSEAVLDASRDLFYRDVQR
jgi:hypothetical protein